MTQFSDSGPGSVIASWEEANKEKDQAEQGGSPWRRRRASWSILSPLFISLVSLYTRMSAVQVPLILQEVDPGRRQDVSEQSRVWFEDRHRNKASTCPIIFKAPEMSESPHTNRPGFCLHGPWQSSSIPWTMSMLSKHPPVSSYFPVSLWGGVVPTWWKQTNEMQAEYPFL